MVIYNETTTEATCITELGTHVLLVAFLSFGCCFKSTDGSHSGKCPTAEAAGAQTSPGPYDVKEEKNSAVSEEGLYSMGYRTSKTQAWNY